MKVKRQSAVLKRLRRRIQDIPFYGYEYAPDDLPFDPAKPFILDQIGKPFSQSFLSS